MGNKPLYFLRFVGTKRYFTRRYKNSTGCCYSQNINNARSFQTAELAHAEANKINEQMGRVAVMVAMYTGKDTETVWIIIEKLKEI